jgi:anti-sigma regulatory factor (Ser/Thr protein kinase)
VEITVPQDVKVIRVSDASHAGDARRRAALFAEQLGLGEHASGALAIVVTEVVTNVVKHAGSGSVLLTQVGQNGNRGVRVLALDKGPGIKDISAALRDGHSTAGTAGNGLGAIKRLSTVFDIYSAPGAGTAVLAEVSSGKKNDRSGQGLEVGVVSAPINGEEVCGDGWGTKLMTESAQFMVVDGLGHGVLASEAAREAERIFAESQSQAPGPILQDSHDALKKTRGAAMAVAAVNFDRGLVSFAGVGNIGASIASPAASRGLTSHNGTLGHHMQRVQEFSFPWNAESLLVMHSDGLNSRWNLSSYPGIWSKHPALIAGLLYRDFSRERDDVTVLIARARREAGES